MLLTLEGFIIFTPGCETYWSGIMRSSSIAFSIPMVHLLKWQHFLKWNCFHTLFHNGSSILFLSKIYYTPHQENNHLVYNQSQYWNLCKGLFKILHCSPHSVCAACTCETLLPNPALVTCTKRYVTGYPYVKNEMRRGRKNAEREYCSLNLIL